VVALLGLVLEGDGVRKVAPLGGLVALLLLGTGLLFGDSAITPAISVLSAVEGLAVAAPGLTPWVVPVTCAILLALFSIQRRGTASVGALFGPVMVLWFLSLAVLGVVHIADSPAVLAALLPTHAVTFFLENRVHGFLALGSVVLAFTGAEALYADLGHFGRTPIRRAWYMLVFPALLLNYLGQGAMLLEHPERADVVFFAMVPAGPLTWMLIALATAAAIIASQALISGMFSLVSHAVQLGYFPRVTIQHTSESTEGQIYAPEINWGMAVATLALVLGFKSSSGLAAAYGVAVTGTLCVTSIAFYQVCRARWGWPVRKALPLLLLFLAFDLPYFAANLVKIGSGGYVPLVIAALAYAMMVTWKRGRILLADHFASNAWTMERFRAMVSSGEIVRVPGCAIVMASTDQYVPLILSTQVQLNRTLHQRVGLLTVRVISQARVPAERRLEVRDLGDGLWRLVLTFGFMDEPDVPRALELGRVTLGLPFLASETVFLLGHESFVASGAGRMGRAQERLFAFLARNAVAATEWFRLPAERVLEIGVRLDL
jgi:KUP system potassium uptake protein